MKIIDFLRRTRQASFLPAARGRSTTTVRDDEPTERCRNLAGCRRPRRAHRRQRPAPGQRGRGAEGGRHAALRDHRRRRGAPRPVLSPPTSRSACRAGARSATSCRSCGATRSPTSSWPAASARRPSHQDQAELGLAQAGAAACWRRSPRATTACLAPSFITWKTTAIKVRRRRTSSCPTCWRPGAITRARRQRADRRDLDCGVRGGEGDRPPRRRPGRRRDRRPRRRPRGHRGHRRSPGTGQGRCAPSAGSPAGQARRARQMRQARPGASRRPAVDRAGDGGTRPRGRPCRHRCRGRPGAGAGLRRRRAHAPTTLGLFVVGAGEGQRAP